MSYWRAGYLTREPTGMGGYRTIRTLLNTTVEGDTEAEGLLAAQEYAEEAGYTLQVWAVSDPAPWRKE